MQRHSSCYLTGHVSASSAPPPLSHIDRQVLPALRRTELQPETSAADEIASFAQRYRHAHATVAEDKRRFFDFFLAVCQGISPSDAAYVYGVSPGRASTYRRRLLEEGPDALFTFFEKRRRKASPPRLPSNALSSNTTKGPCVRRSTDAPNALHVPGPAHVLLPPNSALASDKLPIKAAWPIYEEPPLSDTGVPTLAQRSYFLRYTREHMDQIPPESKRRFTAFMMICEGKTQSYAGAEMGIHPESLERDADLLACAGPKALFNHLSTMYIAPTKKMPSDCGAPALTLEFTEIAACADKLGPEPPLADGLIPTEAQRAYYVGYADAHMDQLPALTRPRATMLALVCQGMSQPRAAQQTRIPESNASTYLRILARRGPKIAFTHFLNQKVISCAKQQKPWQPRPGRTKQDRVFGTFFNHVKKAGKAAKIARRRATYYAEFNGP